MRHKILTQGRYSTVTSTLALFLALGGTAYAINTVDSLDIVNDSVASVDVKNETLSSVDVHDGTLTGTDVLDNTLTGPDVQNESLTGADIDDNTVQSADIQTGTILGQDLADTVAVRSVWVTLSASGQRLGGDNVRYSERMSTGRYRVAFVGAGLDTCAGLATAGNRTIGATPVADGVVTLGMVDDEDVIAVTTTVGGVLQDMDFSVGLLC